MKEVVLKRAYAENLISKGTLLDGAFGVWGTEELKTIQYLQDGMYFVQLTHFEGVMEGTDKVYFYTEEEWEAMNKK